MPSRVLPTPVAHAALKAVRRKHADTRSMNFFGTTAAALISETDLTDASVLGRIKSTSLYEHVARGRRGSWRWHEFSLGAATSSGREEWRFQTFWQPLRGNRRYLVITQSDFYLGSDVMAYSSDKTPWENYAEFIDKEHLNWEREAVSYPALTDFDRGNVGWVRLGLASIDAGVTRRKFFDLANRGYWQRQIFDSERWPSELGSHEQWSLVGHFDPRVAAEVVESIGDANITVDDLIPFGDALQIVYGGGVGKWERQRAVRTMTGSTSPGSAWGSLLKAIVEIHGNTAPAQVEELFSSSSYVDALNDLQFHSRIVRETLTRPGDYVTLLYQAGYSSDEVSLLIHAGALPSATTLRVSASLSSR